MAEPLSSYKKLPGRAAGSVVGTVRLWYRDDHMICVSSAFGYESYQRVYFRDIEALIVRQTERATTLEYPFWCYRRFHGGVGQH